MTKRTTIRLIPPLQEDLSTLAEEMGVSYNQLVNYALTRFIESQKGVSVLEKRARRGSTRAFLKVLEKADRTNSRNPAKENRIPSGYNRKALRRLARKGKAAGIDAS